MHRLPRPDLCPLWIRAMAGHPRLPHPADATPNTTLWWAALRMDRERPWRVANQRRRLSACYWAGWVPDWMRPTRGLLRAPMGLRHGFVPPKWLGRHTRLPTTRNDEDAFAALHCP
jgi:hypothetical protein